MAKLWIYGFPGGLGGADTKLDHTLPIFLKLFDEVMCVANAPSQYDPPNDWTRYLDKLGVKYGLKEDMQGYQEGEIALSLCNPYFFKQGFCDDAKSKGLKVIWSSEMMWHHQKELEYVNKGMVDKVLYVSDIQKASLTYPESMPWSMTGNFINADRFPFQRRSANGLVLGRLSRHDPYKYPEDFPVFYEEIVEDLQHISFRIMSWDEVLADKYKWHTFDHRWKFFKAYDVSALDFLYMLNVMAYPLGHNFVESWGRSTVEGMLTGAIPISFSGHNISNLVVHGESGFIVDDILEWKEIIKQLYHDVHYRQKLSKQCSDHARDVLCNEKEHLKIWEDALLK